VIRRAVVLALSVACAPPALADQPLLRPNRDVDVTYRGAAPNGGAAIEQRMRWLAATQTMRIDPPDPRLHVIIDYVARRMSVVQDATRSVIEMAAPPSIVDAMGSHATTTYVRHGEATVAGQTCTEWQTQDRAANPVVVCITADGVLLRAGTTEQVRVTAVSVQYTPQDPAAFRVPADYARQTPQAPR
jgi:hypothetical protein